MSHFSAEPLLMHSQYLPQFLALVWRGNTNVTYLHPFETYRDTPPSTPGESTLEVRNMPYFAWKVELKSFPMVYDTPILHNICVSYTVGKLLKPTFQWSEVRNCVSEYLLPASLPLRIHFLFIHTMYMYFISGPIHNINAIHFYTLIIVTLCLFNMFNYICLIMFLWAVIRLNNEKTHVCLSVCD